MLTAIHRKDDYAFFLQPVDLTAVPNYTDVIPRPMDFGTITSKVEKGKYRSLEEFAVRFSPFHRFAICFLCTPTFSISLLSAYTTLVLFPHTLEYVYALFIHRLLRGFSVR